MTTDFFLLQLMIGLIIKLLRSYKLTDINLDKLEKNSASDSRSCFHCNGFDSSIPQHSAWKFWLIKGCYLSHDQLLGCEQFRPIVPYQPPSLNRRPRGHGSGQIRQRQSHGTLQYWYHFELWKDGDRLIKSTAYIPKGKLEQVQLMEQEKRPVAEILALLNYSFTRG
jgi:hypothetical protein